MKLITRDTDYAIRALCYVANSKDKIITTQQIAKELKMPWPFLRKIFRILNKKGMLSSSKGKGGGFALTLPPHKIFLVDLIEIFQGPLKINNCFIRKKLCPDRDNCMLRQKIDIIEKNIVSQLKALTIASLK